VGRRCAVFRTGKRVAPISRTRLLLEETVDRFRLSKEAHALDDEEEGDVKLENCMRTFSSSSFFSERCFRLRAVSSRLSAISASFSCFFLRDVSSMPR